MVDRPTLFANEDKYDDLILKYIKLYGSSLSITNVKGVIAQESGFVASARREEPKINDVSIGLMQTLIGTAKMLGFNPQTESLYTPEVSIKYGTKYLDDKLKQYKKYSDAYASYNAGSVRRTASGEYINQFYVNVVSAYASFYYYRDIKKDYAQAVTVKQRIRDLRNAEGKAELASTQVPSNGFTAVEFVAILTVVLLMVYLVFKGK